MVALRTLQPLARQVPRLASTARAPLVARRFLTSDAPVLYSAHAKVVGARTGHVEGDDLNIDLTMAKSLGGEGAKGKSNPEELFAAGYGACFQAAMTASAASMKIKMPENKEDSVIETTVHLIGDAKALDMGLKVDMLVKIRGMDPSQMEKVIEKAKEVCPYSRATKGNVVTTVKVEKME